MFIRTERLFLRPAWPEEAGELAALLDDVASRVKSNMASCELPSDLADVAEAGNAAPPTLLITIPSADGSALIGGIKLTSDNGTLHSDYWLSCSHRGNGYVAEAARGILALTRALGHARVFASQSLDDRASLLVLTRAGFRPSGEQRAEPGLAEPGPYRRSGNDADEMRAA